MAELDYGVHPAGQPAPAESYKLRAGAFINILGGIVSLALIGGIVVWGYQIISRDVSGVPVVQALDGPMRKAPETPGGQAADHQGLAVNEVAALGTAGAPRDSVTLAPAAVTLTDEDSVQAELVSATVAVEAASEVAEVAVTELAEAEQPTEAELLAAILAENPAPLAPVEEADTAVEAQPAVLDLGPGVTRSLRPQIRPKRDASAVVVQASASTNTLDIDPATIPAGTRLVQLGAFDSAEVARSEWDRLNGQFGDFMAGKSRVVQEANKAGQTFYRLRAHGFEDVADARRFCSALVAQNAACIPVLSQ
ncbi:MAG: SPOR domain-containing protein [Pseudomonadota bacterium]